MLNQLEMAALGVVHGNPAILRYSIAEPAEPTTSDSQITNWQARLFRSDQVWATASESRMDSQVARIKVSDEEERTVQEPCDSENTCEGSLARQTRMAKGSNRGHVPLPIFRVPPKCGKLREVERATRLWTR